MLSIFEKLWKLGPAAFVLKAILAAIVADGLLVVFILVRRTYRRRFFAKRDARVFEWRQKWEDLISGKIPFERWRNKPFDRRIIESIALDAFETAAPKESARLLNFLRASGLIEKRIFEAQRLHGWRRNRALVALGRTRAPEGISALGAALRDRNLEIRLAALRGLGRMANPKAAEEILVWVGEEGLSVPALPLQSALVQCCTECPQMLLPYVRYAEGPVREVLGRVLGEVANPAVGLDLLQFVDDDLDELRSAAARGMSKAKSGLAFDVLNKLAMDPVWFVRLRAIVSLGKLRESRATPSLLRGLTDSHRLVRLRAAEALVDLPGEMAATFEQVVATGDRYGLHAYLTALENADCRAQLEKQLQSDPRFSDEERNRLLKVLQSGALLMEEPELTPSEAASLP
ncbi:MAG TPA: HEAT repeat domain-containing protein [Candidatus Acidoferrum sp.]|nr:HEAT repeat domain-containing protein [Candidatus Acidoferrum sp.]